MNTAVRAPAPERLVAVDAHEGPVYVADEAALYFTTVRTDRVAVKRLDLGSDRVSVVCADANMANGMVLDADGDLIVCEQGTHTTRACISRMDRVTGRREPMVDEVDGAPLSSPNDVAIAPDGAIWFTDPSYGYRQGFRPPPSLPDSVYRHDPRTGRTTRVAGEFDKPNGLVFAPDGEVLYVSDNGAPHHLLAFDVLDGERLGAARVHSVGDVGHPDGLAVDAAGNVYASAHAGVRVYDRHGTMTAELPVPGAVNFTFGGADLTTLLITADSAIWAVTLDAKGPSR